MEEKKKEKKFKNFGPAFLILALGIGSGEFILWPFLTANYGFGILWGALLGISLQLFLINIISRDTLVFKENIILSFSKVFSWAFFWIIFSTILGFGWPGFSSLISELIIGGFFLGENIFLPLAILILILAGSILIFSQNAYKKILFLEKIAMSGLLLLSLFLFIFYFDVKLFLELIFGFVGLGNNYFFIPDTVEIAVFFSVFLGAVAYAGSGGNLLLLNSSYVLEEENNNEGKLRSNFPSKLKSIFKNNLLFFWGGGMLIISMLSYVSYAVLKDIKNLPEDFSFLILESEIFTKDISIFIGYGFIILGAMALFGVQLGIFDFIGRIFKNTKKNYKNFNEKFSDKQAYSSAIIFTVLFGILIFLLGIEKPKSLIIIGAVINAFSMGVIALLLLLLEIKKIPENIKSRKIIIGLSLTSFFYFIFFAYVFWQNIF